MIEIPLSQGFATIIDDEDRALADLKWFTLRYDSGRVYAVRNKSAPERGLLRMHRLITGAPVRMEVDHINGDTLDNRRSNLRIVTRAQNAQNLAIRKTNLSGYRGVRWHAGAWEACVMIDRKIAYHARFNTLDEAVTAVHIVRAQLMPFDEQGRLNIDAASMPAPKPKPVTLTHCQLGHELSGGNLFIEAYGGRRCRTCRREQRQARYALRRQELTRRAWSNG